ncbi:MAG: hypothetical protein K2Y22_00210 [Candidatus Obscuribacterales bacterium]|nr:hypothetical protein [Candidatus Obscuribacterales bacterium]
MTEKFSESRDNANKHSVEHNLAQSLFSDGNFWLDTAKGLLPQASESLQEGVRTGEVWGALGEGAALGIGLSWMTNQLRPAPVRIIGGLINTGILGKFAWDSGQTVGQLLDLKKHAYESGNYRNNVSRAQKLSGKFVADNAVGILGAHIGFVGEHGIHHAMSSWKGKPQLASTVPVGLESSGHPLGNPHDVAESPFYMAMSKARRNKKAQQRANQSLPETRTESTKAADSSSKAETKTNEIDLSPKIETFQLLNEQAIRKGRPADTETFEDLSAVKRQRDKEAFNVCRKKASDDLGAELFSNTPKEKRGVFLDEVRSLRREKNDETLAEMLLSSIETSAAPHIVEARVDRALNANKIFASEILRAAKDAPLVRDLFIEARKGLRDNKYPEDAYVVFVDEKGRLVTFTNDHVAGRTFNYPLKDIGRGVVDFNLIGSDIVKGAAIFGSPHVGNRPLLGIVGEVPSRLADCGNYKEFFLTSRLDKKLSQFDFKTDVHRELKSLEPQAPLVVSDVVVEANVPKCEDGVCSIEASFIENLRAKVLSQKSEAKDIADPAGRFDPLAALEKEEKGLLDQLAMHEQARADGIQTGLLNKKQRKVIDKRLLAIKDEKSALGPVSEETVSATLEAIEQAKPESAVTTNTMNAAPINARAKEYLDIDLEARLQGSPEGIYGRIMGIEPGFKEQLPKSKQEHFAKKADEAAAGQSESTNSVPQEQAAHESQTKSESQVETSVEKPQTRQKKFYNKDDHDAMELDLRLENELLADAFASANAGSKEIPGDKLVFFVRDGNLIKRVNFADAHGNERPMMNTKLDFHFGKVPVELLKNSVIGWARVAPKVRDGEIVYRQNARGGRPQADTEVVEVGGEVPGSMKRALDQNKEVSYGDLMRVPGKVVSEAKAAESAAEAILSKLVKERRVVEGRLYDHYRNEEGRVLSPEEFESVTLRYEKIKELIAKHERNSTVNDSLESTSASIADQFALSPAEPRVLKFEQGDRLPADITSQLESWRSNPRGRTQPDDRVPNDAEKLDALVHVAYNAHSFSKELFAQGKYAEAEAWAMTLYNMVKAADRSERFDSEDKVRVLSWLGEVFRVQNKMNQAESCLKAARLELEKISKVADAKALEASILESYAKLLRAETTQSRLQEARQCEASRRDIIDGLLSEGKDPNSGVDVWKKALISMRDRRTLKVSMENNAKLLDRSLQILNWFGIKL